MKNMQKHFARATFVFVLAMMLALTGGCQKKGASEISQEEEKKIVSGDTKWSYEKTIATPITVRSGAEAAALGDIEVNKARIEIPAGSFDAETEVSIQTPDSVPDYLGEEAKMLGTPIEIKAGAETRLNQPVAISFKYDAAQLDMTRGTTILRVAYYNGSHWEYIKPLSVDSGKQIITFETYHFSLFGANQISDDKVITESWIHSQTLDKQMKENLNKVSDHVAEQIIDLTLQKMGISDESLKGKILADVLKDDGYKGIYDAYQSGDVTDLNQKIALLAGKKIASIVPESAWQEGLKNITEASGDIAAVSQAAGFIAGGQYKDAARIIGEQIADKFIITTAGKIAVEVINGQIESWKNNEVEAAYVAYRDGANAKFYGYNVDSGDFDTVWSQMRGIGRQLVIEAVKRENAARLESGLPRLTEKQEEMVRVGVKESYRRQFTLRSEREEELKKEEEKLRLLVDAFKRNNLFDATTGPAGLDKGFDHETKLKVLYHFAEKMMRDTKRFDLSDKSGLIMEKALSVEDVAQGARLYFTVPDGRKLYAKYIKDRFNISLAPALKDLAGSWPSGKLIIRDVILPAEMIREIEAKKDQPKSENPLEGGCDFSIDPRLMKGKEVPLTALITPAGESGGTIKFNFEEGEIDPLNFTYDLGEIKGSMSKDGATGALDLSVDEDDQAYAASGSFNITFGQGATGQMLIDINMSKSKTVAKPAETPNAKALGEKKK